MTAIFQGRRYHLISQRDATVSLEPIAAPGSRIEISMQDPDLILHPTADDLHLAEAFERGEIGAFEYPHGHTYPAGREIPSRRRRFRPRSGANASVH